MNTKELNCTEELKKVISYIPDSLFDVESLNASGVANFKPSQRYFTQSGFQLTKGVTLNNFKKFKMVPANGSIKPYLAAEFENGMVSVSRLATSPSRPNKDGDYSIYRVKEGVTKADSELLATDLVRDNDFGKNIADRFADGLWKDIPSVLMGLTKGTNLRLVDIENYHTADGARSTHAIKRGYASVICLWEQC